jgi:tRNA1(Val) A37 N6-methylase TrmN6
MSLDDLLAASAHLLAPGGTLALCWKPERAGELARAADHGLARVRLRPVRSRDGDAPYLLLVSFRRGVEGAHGFAELPPLTVYRGRAYAPEAAAILAGGTAAAPLAGSTDRG